MNEARICKNCGAPLHGYKCDYCGTEYERPTPTYTIEHVSYDTETLACKCAVSLEVMRKGDESAIVDYVKHKVAREITENLLKYMDVETWIDPHTMQQVFGGRVRVVKPR